VSVVDEATVHVGEVADGTALTNRAAIELMTLRRCRSEGRAHVPTETIRPCTIVRVSQLAALYREFAASRLVGVIGVVRPHLTVVVLKFDWVVFSRQSLIVLTEDLDR
jgi:hypothetical protein